MKQFFRQLPSYLKENRKYCVFAFAYVFALAFYFITEAIVPTEGYFVSYLPLDDLIPFCEWFIFPYVLWYLYLAIPLLFALFLDAPAFRRVTIFIFAGVVSALTFCILVPNGQDLRPDFYVRDNIAMWVCRLIYTADTNTNVLPSMHVNGCVAICLLAFDSPVFRRARVPLLLCGILIMASTVLVKQHSILDVFAALVLCVVLYIAVYLLPRVIRRATGRKRADTPHHT